MYRYDAYDHALVWSASPSSATSCALDLAGELTDDEFRPLRLQNGLYIQRHAPMLRVAMPYGMLSSTQLRKLADIGRRYDRGYGHFTTRQNMQFNWPKLEDTADILAELATVEMHAIQTSGNCIRNITTDQFAGVAPTRSSIRVRTAKSCASGRPSTRNSPSCRASSRSPSTAPGRPRRDLVPRHRPAALPQTETARCFTRHRRRRPGRTPILGSMIRDACPGSTAHLSGSHAARLQPLRPSRQRLQGAHQDSGQGDRRGRIRAPGRMKNGSSTDGIATVTQGRTRARRRRLHGSG
jgi:hypothetical protein